jgi:hypothetical protein
MICHQHADVERKGREGRKRHEALATVDHDHMDNEELAEPQTISIAGTIHNDSDVQRRSRGTRSTIAILSLRVPRVLR